MTKNPWPEWLEQRNLPQRESFMRWDGDDVVRISRVKFTNSGWVYAYVTVNTVGVFPGIYSDEFIEVVW